MTELSENTTKHLQDLTSYVCESEWKGFEDYMLEETIQANEHILWDALYLRHSLLGEPKPHEVINKEVSYLTVKENGEVTINGSVQ
jgi:hypothetical protein